MPTPSPTPLRVIVTVQSSAFCTAVRAMTLPVGYVVGVNQEAISAMAGDTAAIFAPTASKTDPSSNRAQDRLREATFDVAQNLTLAENVLNASWKEFPKGSDAKVDAMRQRLQNLIDLQRSLLAKYQQVAERDNNPCLIESYAHSLYCLRESGTAQMLTVDDVRMLMRAGISGQLLTQSEATDPGGAAKNVAHDVARFGDVAHVEKQLTLQEMAFSKEAQVAGNTCGI